MSKNNDYDFITINTMDSAKKNAELVSKFEIQGLGEYVIYKLDGELYGAKYKFDGINTKLITELTDNEKNILNEMVNKLEEK